MNIELTLTELYECQGKRLIDSSTEEYRVKGMALGWKTKLVG